MADDNPKRWHRLPKINLNNKTIKKHVRKIEGATKRHAHRFVIKRWSNVIDVQKKVISWLVIMAVLIAATGLQMAWYQKSYKTTAQGLDGAYAEAVLGPVDTLNPLYASSSAEQSVSYLLFSRILNYDTTGNLNYDLATNISINDAKTVYTVKIRPDVKWHDGASLTAKDIAFTVNLMKDTNTRSVITGWSNISVKVIDDTTIEFTLPSAYAAFEHALNFAILPEHILGKISPANIRENSFSQNPIGSGPFKLSFIQNSNAKNDNEIIYLSRNDSYYNGTAKLLQLQLHVYDTTDEIITALAKNEVNATADLSSSDVKLVDSTRYNIKTMPIQSGVYAIINTGSSILSDVNVRRALQLATNTTAIIDRLPDGTPSLDLPFTNGQIGDNAPTAPKYDLNAAKKILDDNGWGLNANGVRVKDGKELKLSIVTMKDSEYESVLEILAGQWRALGITIDTKVVDPTDTTQNVDQNILQPRNFDVLLYQLDIGSDPDEYAYWHSSQATSQGLNYSNYSNAISDDALLSARSRTETDLRNAKYITFAKQWLSDVPAVGLYQSTMQYVSNKNVQAFSSSDKFVSQIDRYSDVLNWSVGERSVYKTP